MQKKETETTLEPGFYWTRSTDREYPGISISERNGRLWHSSGVSATSEPHEIEVLSPCIRQPSEETTVDETRMIPVIPKGWFVGLISDRVLNDGIFCDVKLISCDGLRETNACASNLRDAMMAAIARTEVA